jgi:mannitol/fructose-specific phosphotransferase system IIA component (Ntr-type)
VKTLADFIFAAKSFVDGEVNGPYSFKELLIAGMIHTNQSYDDLAVAFEVASSTVKRWESGVAVPHPRVQRLIVSRLLWIARRDARSAAPKA